MSYKGKGHSVGPNFTVEGPMVFNIYDNVDHFLLAIYEDKEFTDDPQARRGESAIALTHEQLQEFCSYWAELLPKRLQLWKTIGHK